MDTPVTPPAAAQGKPVSLPKLPFRFRGLLVPLLAIFTAVLIGSVLILLAGLDPFRAYAGLLQGAFGTDAGIVRTLIKMAPLLFAGLSLTFAFKGGLFNIGAQGQLVVGSLFAAWVGFAVQGLPPAVHVTLAMIAGFIGGALWGLIPGLLKAYTGAHEVIVTIMLNYIAALLLEWAVAPARASAPAGPFAFCKEVGSCAIGQTPEILPSAILPSLYTPAGGNESLHLGVFFAVFAAILVYIVINRTTFGFELRMVGLNPNAAKYAGVNVARMTILTMVIAGGLAGLAGGIQTLGVNYRFQVNQSLTIGFDSIAVSLLASNNPLAVIPSSFLFGAMSAGGTNMQATSRVPADLIQVVQALILMFVAADQIIRNLYRLKKAPGDDKIKLSTGWGQR